MSRSIGKNFQVNRRSFLKQITLAGIAAPFVTRDLLAASPNDVLRHASFGASGMAGTDISSIIDGKLVQLVAVADVDSTRTASLKRKYPGLKVYQDWRELLEKEGSTIDSVNVSTPDHMHAPIAMSALQLGKHVYCEKPLTHEIYEARRLAEVAREKKLVTQMGIQIHSDLGNRLAVKILQDGVIGKIKEVHSFSNKKWGDTTPLPERQDPVPAGLNWDLWLGVAADRPYIGNGYYHPGNWRKRLDFGTGTFGDMGCHIIDPVFVSLALTAPVSVRSEGPAPTAHNWANNARIQYIFPGTDYTDGKTVQVTWYDGDQRPPAELQSLLEGDSIPGQGSIFIGTKGVMLLPHMARPQLYPDAQFKDLAWPSLPPENHWKQFTEACRGNGVTSTHFDYSGPLTEAVLLGGLATRFPKATLQWDSPALKFTNEPEANKLLRREYRKGWEVTGLS
jgi:predicted dehydrogenase